jgi:cellulase/cellobiase CelA1
VDAGISSRLRAGIAEDARAGRIEPDAIDEARLGSELAVAALPDPDLFIRTGGEMRISNFLLWNLAYTELYFSPLLWPDFDAAALDAALDFYAGRERRFGRTEAEAEGAAVILNAARRDAAARMPPVPMSTPDQASWRQSPSALRSAS